MNRCIARSLAALVCLAALAGAALTSGCGQKGPLYLPGEKLDELERRRDEREQRNPA